MSVSRKLMGTTKAGGGQIDISDYFSTYLYTGNGSTQTITNGIDLAGEGGLVWIKDRVGAFSHNLADTERGANNYLFTDSPQAQFDAGTARISSFNSDGFSLGSGSNGTNASGNGHASWTFRKAPRFFDVVTYTGNGVAGRTVSHNLGTTVGTILVKNLTSAEYFAVYHISQGETKYALLGNIDAFSTFAGAWDNTAPTTTEFSVGNWAKVNTNGDQYVAYLFAHDPLGPSEDGSDGLISCGTFTTDNGGNATVDLGWEPQWLLVKQSDAASNWRIIDNMRGWTNGSGFQLLKADEGVAESPWASGILPPSATGFSGSYPPLNGAATYIYIAIRRGPMRVPTSGTEVFKPSYGLNASNSEIVNAGFPIDLNWRENVTGGFNVFLQDRMRGFDNFLSSNTTSAEGGAGGTYSGTQNGIRLAATLNFSSWINWSFRRAPNFFDVVAYTGDGVAGRTVPHNLGVAPEMMIVKDRNGSSDWIVYHSGKNDSYGGLNTTAAFSTSNVGYFWGNNDQTVVQPTDSVFTIGGTGAVNWTGNPFIAYLFATLAGVSKVGSYTGNGSSQTINCGFTTGARFILIKRTDSTGDWYVWDTARGIVAGNDPHLSLNTSTAEVTSDDSIDPASSGFIVNQLAATNINVSAASYIFYAVA